MACAPYSKHLKEIYGNKANKSHGGTFNSSSPHSLPLYGKEQLGHSVQYLFLASTKGKVRIFGWNIPLKVHNVFFLLHICLQRILYVCKSSWSPWIEVNRNVDIYYRSVTTKLTTQILWPKVPWNHRTFICLSESFSQSALRKITWCKRSYLLLLKPQGSVKKIMLDSRSVTMHVSCIERFTGSSKWKWSSLSPWSGDFGVNRARACHYVVVWNTLGEGSDLISSLSSAGMFPWQRSTVCVSRFTDGHQHKKNIHFTF